MKIDWREVRFLLWFALMTTMTVVMFHQHKYEAAIIYAAGIVLSASFLGRLK